MYLYGTYDVSTCHATIHAHSCKYTLAATVTEKDIQAATCPMHVRIYL